MTGKATGHLLSDPKRSAEWWITLNAAGDPLLAYATEQEATETVAIDGSYAQAVAKVVPAAERDRYRDALTSLEPFLRYTLGEVPGKGWPYCAWSPMDVNPRLRKAVAAISHAHDDSQSGSNPGSSTSLDKDA